MAAAVAGAAAAAPGAVALPLSPGFPIAHDAPVSELPARGHAGRVQPWRQALDRGVQAPLPA